MGGDAKSNLHQWIILLYLTMVIYTSSIYIYLKPRFFPAFILFTLGIGLFLTSGKTTLMCERMTDHAVRCLIRETTSIGIIETGSETINAVQSAKIDHRVKQTHDTETDDTPRRIDRDVYGVVLIGEKEVLLDAYDYDLDRQRYRLTKIQSFLKNPLQQQFTLEIRNLWSTVLSLAALGGAIALFLSSELKSRQRKKKTYLEFSEQSPQNHR